MKGKHANHLTTRPPIPTYVPDHKLGEIVGVESVHRMKTKDGSPTSQVKIKKVKVGFYIVPFSM